MTAAVLVAAGSSQRMGFDKLAADLNGLSVLATCTLRFALHERIDQLILVASPERTSALRAELDQAGHQAICWIQVEGGVRRQDSVAQGLAACPESTTLVAVHDAARPLVCPSDIAATLDAAAAQGGAVLASPVADSLLRAETGGETDALPLAAEAVDRSQLWAAQTPQCFQLVELRRALDYCRDQGIEVSDEVAAARSIHLPVAVVSATAPNFKLTRAEDLVLARLVIRAALGKTET